jgi:hypothetical protein
MKAMLDPRIVAANTHFPAAGEDSPEGAARIAASSQGDLEMVGMTYCQLERSGALWRPLPRT